ncbi:hypothetical protein [Candidatus Williamhamiltonella defendens]|nr:hypothetical protein [Candidatus Hamiltonella defensa]
MLKNFIPIASDEHQVNFQLSSFQEDDNYAQFSTNMMLIRINFMRLQSYH